MNKRKIINTTIFIEDLSEAVERALYSKISEFTSRNSFHEIIEFHLYLLNFDTKTSNMNQNDNNVNYIANINFMILMKNLLIALKCI